jgi:hypothetical protein
VKKRRERSGAEEERWGEENKIFLELKKKKRMVKVNIYYFNEIGKV